MSQEFTPKFFTLFKQGFTREQVTKDVLSGLIVGIVALPLAIAFAIASGVSPEKGIVTAIVAGLIVSVFGGSRVQIGGPTGAFIVIVYGIVQQHGLDGLTIATFLAGFIIIGMGLLKLGNLMKFIPYPLIIGFTSAIALIIFSSQIKDFFGLKIDALPADFIGKWMVYARNLEYINWYSVVIASLTILITIFFHKITPKIPGSIAAIVLSTLVVYLFHVTVDTIGSKFTAIPDHFTMPGFPKIDFDVVKSLIQPAFAIAMLGGIESLLSAVVSDGMIGGKHRSNMELVAQGGANIFSAIFGGIPATGAIARTATNIKNGGRTPIAGIVHSLILVLIMLAFSQYVKLIPMACLAGILVVVAYNMSEWRHFKTMLKGDRMDVIVLLTTFFLTLIFDLVIAIEIGVVLSSFLFMKRMSDSLQVKGFSIQADSSEKLFEEELENVPKEIMLYEINGPLFFGAAQQFSDALSNTYTTPKIIILRMRYVPFIDATGYRRLKESIQNFKSRGVIVILSGVKEELRIELNKYGLQSVMDENLIFGHISQAINHARSLINNQHKSGR